MWTPAARRQHSRDSLRYGSDLSDAEWALIAPFMPPPARTGPPASAADAGHHERNLLRPARWDCLTPVAERFSADDDDLWLVSALSSRWDVSRSSIIIS